MVYKRKYKKKRRNYRKRKPRSDTLYSVNMTNPFPNKFITKMRYQEAIKMNPGVATVAATIFRANSVFDPNFTGVGHQPRYFDEIMPLYDHYVVIGSKITCTFVNNQNSAYVCGVMKGDDALFTNTVNGLIEQRKSKWQYLAEQASGGNIKKVTLTFSPKKLLGIKDPMSSDELKGTVSTNPAEGAFFNVWAGTVDEAEDGGQIECHVIVDYIVAFIEPKEVVQS